MPDIDNAVHMSQNILSNIEKGQQTSISYWISNQHTLNGLYVYPKLEIK